MCFYSCGGNDYEYSCDEGEPDSTEGVWKFVGDQDQDPNAIDESTKALKDVVCNAPDLVLHGPTYAQAGLEIQCVEVGGNGGVIDVTDPDKPTVKAQGNCLLLCDWYPVLNFYTRSNCFKSFQMFSFISCSSGTTHGYGKRLIARTAQRTL